MITTLPQPTEEIAVITLEDAVAFCRKAEPLLEKVGYHCGLTGGTLYRGASGKDMDIILYPHDPKRLQQEQLLVDTLRPLGLSSVFGNPWLADVWATTPDYCNRRVLITSHEGKRVDLFILNS